MALYLVQHGKALDKHEDRLRGLSADGRADVERIANVASGYGVRVSRIQHSGKTRARQTAEIFAAALKPERGVQERGDLGPMDDVTTFAVPQPDENVMLVGHLPFLGRLAAHLVTGDAHHVVFAFQNGGIVCLGRVRDVDHWVIRWTLSPEIG